SSGDCARPGHSRPAHAGGERDAPPVPGGYRQYPTYSHRRDNSTRHNTDHLLRRRDSMSARTIAAEFVELCRQGKNFDVMRTMYSRDIVSVEGDGTETVGQAPVIKKSEVWQSNNAIHSEQVRGPFFNGLNQFAVHFTFEVTPKRN